MEPIAEDRENASRVVLKVRGDPEWFLRTILRFDPWSKQIEIAEALRDHSKVAVKSCHSSGKTAIAGRLVLWFLCAYPPALAPTTAPTWRQVEELLWREIRAGHLQAGEGDFPLGGKMLTTKYELAVNSYAIGLSTKEPERFQGFHSINILFVADEAPGISEEVYEGADTTLTTENARELLIGNPVEPSGHFYDAFHSKRHLYYTTTISVFDTPNFTAFGITLEDIRRGAWQQKITGSLPRPYLVTPKWVAEKWQEWGEESPLWYSRVLGEFPPAAADQLIPLSWVERAINREIVVPMGTPHILGCDVARYGEDASVIVARTGDVVTWIEEYFKQDLMETAGRIIGVWQSRDATGINIEQDGMGAGVVDRLREQGYPVRGVVVGSQPMDKQRFRNRRAELWWNLRERFRVGNIQIPRDEELVAQLVAVKYKVMSNGQIEVESKEDMKKRGLKSPDRADALMLAFAGDEVKTEADYERPSVFDTTYFGSERRGGKRKRVLRSWLKPSRTGR